MKRHVAATLLGVLSFLILDSHIDWVDQDGSSLLKVSGRSVDARGWLSEHWRKLRQDCRSLHTEVITSATAEAVLQTIRAHSLPDSLEVQLMQLQQQADWAMAEVEFKTLNPSIVLLRQVKGAWLIQDSAVWSGSTAPWHAADFVRRYLRQQAPELPEPLLACFEIDLKRYSQGPAVLGSVSAIGKRP
jgi:hypothetical protein